MSAQTIIVLVLIGLAAGMLSGLVGVGWRHYYSAFTHLFFRLYTEAGTGYQPWCFVVAYWRFSSYAIS